MYIICDVCMYITYNKRKVNRGYRGRTILIYLCLLLLLYQPLSLSLSVCVMVEITIHFLMYGTFMRIEVIDISERVDISRQGHATTLLHY